MNGVVFSRALCAAVVLSVLAPGAALACETDEQCGESTTCVTRYCNHLSKCAVEYTDAQCRGAADACDVAEYCSFGSCPDDAKAEAGTVCRAANGNNACDTAEVCDGVSAACPADGNLPAGTQCRASGGDCDPAEYCNGSPYCPADARSQAGTVCRGSAGDCDVADACDGVGAACPADARSQAGTVCRGPANDCDVAEACDGAAVACPADAMAAEGVSCESVSACMAGGACTASGVCVGGVPAMTFSPAELLFTDQDRADKLVTISNGGVDPLTITAVLLDDPAETFTVAAAPEWPVTLATGEQTAVTVKFLPLNQGTYDGTLNVKIDGCADQPVALKGTLSSTTAPGGGSCGCSTGGGAVLAAGALLAALLRRRRRS